MPTYHIVIDRDLCAGFGACADVAPDLVEVGADGIATMRTGDSDDERLLDIADSCPMRAITVFDAETGREAA